MSVPKISTRGLSDAQQLVLMAERINSIIDGKIDAVDSFTLTANATTTTVSDNKFESNMVPVWSPATANAAAAMTNVYLSARTKGGFTLTHSNTATTDRTFNYSRLG
jgi:hypothetical protein